MQVHIYTDKTSERLHYILQFIFGEYFQHELILHTKQDTFTKSSGLKINYSHQDILDATLQIKPVALLFEHDITAQNITIASWRDLPIFFSTSATKDVPFDMFAASFYLLSRYEEYLPHEKDEFDRYDHKNSLAYKNNFLDKPLIELWLQAFKQQVLFIDKELALIDPPYNFIPTYDIDIAYSYKYKSFKRTIGGYARDLSKGKIGSLFGRFFSRIHLNKDPYDSYKLIEKTHAKNNLTGIFFFLVGENGPLDKNLPLSKKAMPTLINRLAENNSIGLHPSYQSNEERTMVQAEREALRKVLNQKVKISRQHYIKFSLPETYEHLILLGFNQDYSMGYGSINGFRASTSMPHYWFNLKKNCSTPLRIFPFCFMECNSKFEQKQDIETTQKEIEYYSNIVKQVNGTMISVWHNFSLGSDRLWKGWKALYLEQIEKSIRPKDGIFKKIKKLFN